MLPWGPPDIKFSLGTPKSHIGKPWNFAELTHGPVYATKCMVLKQFEGL